VSTVEEFANSDRQLAVVIQRRYGSPEDSRLVPWIVMTLARAVREDHVALDLHHLVTEASADPSTPRGSVEAIIDGLRASPGLCEFLGRDDDVTVAGTPLVVLDVRFLYFRRLAAAERRVAQALRTSRTTVLEAPAGLTGTVVEAALERIRGELASVGQTSPELERVVATMLTRSISFITGGPGTGKTWIVTQALRALDAALTSRSSAGTPFSFVVAAPTGKAARRVAESISAAMGGEPFTALVRDVDREGSLHHVLGVRPDRLNSAQPLTHDLVIVDEASMADLPMIDLLIRTAQANAERPCHIVFIGDPRQLASVNVGAVLADAVNPDAGIEELVTRLGVAHRFGGERLVDLARAIDGGDGETVAVLLSADDGELRHVDDADTPHLVDQVVRHASRLATLAANGDVTAALATLRELTVLCANREGPGSVAWWNARVRAEVLQEFPPVRGERFGVGEPILVTRNQRSLGLNNGDVGVVIESDGERVVVFDAARHHSLGAIGYAETAWAMTIHKSQGSEYDHVIVVLPRRQSPLLTRELFYTGVTRAKSGVTVVGQLDTVREAIGREIDRVSGLTYRLRDDV
jgi:exodeoxyribonuclease V alpha subunit